MHKRPHKLDPVATAAIYGVLYPFRPCKQCEGPIERQRFADGLEKKRQFLSRKFCSRECWLQFNLARVVGICAQCKKSFEYVRSQNKKFCSIKCWKESRPLRKITVECGYCGCSFERLDPSRRSEGSNKPKMYFCSKECRGKRSGEKHHNWRGGSGKERGLGWPKQAALIRERDLHQCQVCHTAEDKDTGIPVDHIVPYRMWRINHPENLLTVCQSCHSEKTNIERYFLKGDILEFLARLNRAGWPMDIVQGAIRAWGAAA